MRIVFVRGEGQWGMSFIALTVRISMMFAAILCVVGAGWGADGKKSSAKSDSPPEWLKRVTLLKPGKEPPLKSCRVRYSLSWNHVINAGEAQIVLRDRKKSPQNSREILLGEASARSTGPARILWSYDCELKSEVDKSSLRPLWFEHSETENRETVSYRTEFKADHVETMRYETDPETGEVKAKKRNFKHANVYDLLSAILCVRSLPLKNGETITGVIQPFDAPYLVSLKVQGRELREYQGKDQDTIRLGVKIQKINKDLSLRAYKKMKTATLWVSEDEYRLPLEIRADIFVGYVAATLTERDYLTEDEIKSGVLEVPKKKSKMKTWITDSAVKARKWWLNGPARQRK
jgi:hypothetical protein